MQFHQINSNFPSHSLPNGFCWRSMCCGCLYSIFQEYSVKRVYHWDTVRRREIIILVGIYQETSLQKSIHVNNHITFKSSFFKQYYTTTTKYVSRFVAEARRNTLQGGSMKMLWKTALVHPLCPRVADEGVEGAWSRSTVGSRLPGPWRSSQSGATLCTTWENHLNRDTYPAIAAALSGRIKPAARGWGMRCLMSSMLDCSAFWLFHFWLIRSSSSSST